MLWMLLSLNGSISFGTDKSNVTGSIELFEIVVTAYSFSEKKDNLEFHNYEIVNVE